MTAPRQHPGHTNAPAVPTSEVLLAAARLIEERGWAVGEGWPREDREGAPLCLEGGIAAAIGLRFVNALDDRYFNDLTTCPAYLVVQEHLEHSSLLFRWNDAQGRTASEVIEVLRAAALIEAAREQAEVGISGVAAEAAVV